MLRGTLPMKLTRLALLSGVAATLSTSAFAQLPQSRVLTMDVAHTIAQEAMARCRADGDKVTVLVVDALNAPKAMLCADAAAGATTDAAVRPAAAPRPAAPPARSRPPNRHDSGDHQCTGRRADQIRRCHHRRG